MERRGGLGKYLNRGFVFLMSCLVVSVFIFWFTSPHDTAPFMRLMEFGITAWFSLNIAERASDVIKANKNGSSP
jgi:hypothetical protein